MTPAPRHGTPLAFVVAGGRSSRMGRDKALLPYRGATFLEHALVKARAVSSDVAILCGPTRRYEGFGAPVLEDAICGAGPLSGLYSALVSASALGRERMVWLGVDLPLVPPAFLARLIGELDRAEVAIARSPRGPEPLCAAFTTEATLKAVRRALLSGQLKLTSAFDVLKVTLVDGDEGSFANINSPAEYETLPAHLVPAVPESDAGGT